MVEHEGIAPTTPVWKTGMFLSTPMLEENWSPVLELRQPLLFCGQSPELLGQRDIRNGQEAGIRTRTVCVTGRDAADYTTFLMRPAEFTVPPRPLVFS